MRRDHGPHPYSLRWRLVVSFMLVFILGAGSAAAYHFAERGADGDRLGRRILENQAGEFLAGLRIGADGTINVESQMAMDSAFFYTLYDPSGSSVAKSPNLETAIPFSRPSDDDASGTLEIVDAATAQLVAIAVPAPRDHVLLVARRQVEVEALIRTLFEEDLEYLGLIVVPFAAAALALIWFITVRGLHPLIGASRQAAAIDPRNLDARITVTGLPGEVLPLVDAVNGALDRLAEAYAAERRLTVDAAHELRTPLAVLSLRLQRAKLDGEVDWPVIEQEVAQLSRLVGQLLDLASRESAGQTRSADAVPVDLARVVREAAATMLPIAEEQGRLLEVEAPVGVVPVQGHKDELRDMVRNLLENALVHGRGKVCVSVCQRPPGEGPRAVIEVTDEGSGVPAPLREAVFERFRKGVAASPGAGLGLAIVRQVAHGHDGDVHFLSGEGCRVQVFLPLDAGHPSHP